jgi:hypothetical protein
MNLTSDVLLASILHKVGMVRINGTVLIKIISDAADNNVIFKQFKRHLQYHYSEVLDETLYSFVLGGLIKSDGIGYYIVAPRLVGEYGAIQFSELVTDENKTAVKEIAKLIRDQC